MESQPGNRKPLALVPSATKLPAVTAAERKELANALGLVCTLQKAYGKTPAELSTLVDGFLWALQAYPVASIIDALRQYILAKPDIPAPADLLAILDPPEPELSSAWYVELKRRVSAGNVWIGKEDYVYMAAFEAQERAKMRQ